MRLSGSGAYLRAAAVPKMPPGLVELMEGLTKDVLKNNPTNIDKFCANHLEKLLEIRDGPTSKKTLTLEEKIAKAQEKVRQRAKERQQRFDNEMQRAPDTAVHDASEKDDSSKEVQSSSEQEIMPNIRAAVHHEQDLSLSSEVEISYEPTDYSLTSKDSHIDESDEISISKSSTYSSVSKSTVIDLGNDHETNNKEGIDDGIDVPSIKINNTDEPMKENEIDDDQKDKTIMHDNIKLSSNDGGKIQENIQSSFTDNSNQQVIKEESAIIIPDKDIVLLKDYYNTMADTKDSLRSETNDEPRILVDNDSESEHKILLKAPEQLNLTIEENDNQIMSRQNNEYVSTTKHATELNLKSFEEVNVIIEEDEDNIESSQDSNDSITKHETNLDVKSLEEVNVIIKEAENQIDTRQDNDSIPKNATNLDLKSLEEVNVIIEEDEDKFESSQDNDSTTKHATNLDLKSLEEVNIIIEKDENEIESSLDNYYTTNHATNLSVEVVKNDNEALNKKNKEDNISDDNPNELTDNVSEEKSDNILVNEVVTNKDNADELLNETSLTESLTVNANIITIMDTSVDNLKISNPNEGSVKVIKDTNGDQILTNQLQMGKDESHLKVFETDSILTPDSIEKINTDVEITSVTASILRPDSIEKINTDVEITSVTASILTPDSIEKINTDVEIESVTAHTAVDEIKEGFEFGVENITDLSKNNTLNLKDNEDSKYNLEEKKKFSPESDESVNKDVVENTNSTSVPRQGSADDNDDSSVLGSDLSKAEDDIARSEYENVENNMDLETAAVTIQKVFRSFLFKSRNSTFEDITNDEATSLEEDNDKKEEYYAAANLSKERRPLGITRMDTVLQTVNEEKSLSLSTDDSSTLSSAATTIQAHVRGFLVRNKLNSYKTVSTNSLVNSNEMDTDTEQQKNKTVLNIHIVPEEGNYLSRDESVITSMDLSLDGSPQSSINLHPLSYDLVSERRKLLKREDAIQSVSPPSNNSGKLSEESVKEVLLNENDLSKTESITNEKEDQHNPEDNSETLVTAVTAVPVRGMSNEHDNTEIAVERSLSSDESDVITPFVASPRSLVGDFENTSKLIHSGEFHDVVLPTKVSRSDTTVVRGE